MEKQEWKDGAKENVWEKSGAYVLHWNNQADAVQHSVLRGGSYEYVLALADLAADGANPDIDIAKVESFYDDTQRGELAKRGMEKVRVEEVTE